MLLCLGFFFFFFFLHNFWKMRNWCILSCVIRAADSKFMFRMCRETIAMNTWPRASRVLKCNLSDSTLQRVPFACHPFYEEHLIAFRCSPLYIKQASLIHKNHKCVKCCHVRRVDDMGQYKRPNSLLCLHTGVSFCLQLVPSGQSVLDIWSLNSQCFVFTEAGGPAV